MTTYIDSIQHDYLIKRTEMYELISQIDISLKEMFPEDELRGCLMYMTNLTIKELRGGQYVKDIEAIDSIACSVVERFDTLKRSKES